MIGDHHQLGAIGYMAVGSVAERQSRCDEPNCACRAEPPRLHGPYRQWTAKMGGKTVNERLTDRRRTRGQLVAREPAVAGAERAVGPGEHVEVAADQHPLLARSLRRLGDGGVVGPAPGAAPAAGLERWRGGCSRPTAGRRCRRGARQTRKWPAWGARGNAFGPVPVERPTSAGSTALSTSGRRWRPAARPG
ncbi:MAG: DUF6788 family protein, partial [Acidimicrobiales bacterium]